MRILWPSSSNTSLSSHIICPLQTGNQRLSMHWKGSANETLRGSPSIPSTCFTTERGPWQAISSETSNTTVNMSKLPMQFSQLSPFFLFWKLNSFKSAVSATPPPPPCCLEKWKAHHPKKTNPPFLPPPGSKIHFTFSCRLKVTGGIAAYPFNLLHTKVPKVAATA